VKWPLRTGDNVEPTNRRDLRPLVQQLPHRGPNELRATAMSGVEYELSQDGAFRWAWRSVDGHDMTEDEFVSWCEERIS
jgi:hypothetical protein